MGDQCCPMCNPGRSSSRNRAVPGELLDGVSWPLGAQSSGPVGPGCTVFSPGISPGGLDSSATGTFVVALCRVDLGHREGPA